MKIDIYYTHDSYECETCGGNWAESWKIVADGKEYGVDAKAHCFNNTYSTLDEALTLFLQSLGHEVEIHDY